MALSKSEVLALIPSIPPPYVSPYQEYTATIISDGSLITVSSFLINQTGDSSQDGVNDITWSVVSNSRFSAFQSSAPFITSLTDTKAITLRTDIGDLLFAIPTFVSGQQINFDLYYGDGTQPLLFPAFTGDNVLVTIRVFI
jgi:hypothetical protein